MGKTLLSGIVLLLMVTGCHPNLAQREGPLTPAPVTKFRTELIEPVGVRLYQVSAVDMNADGRLDLLATLIPHGPVSWYENPGWQRHSLAEGLEPAPLWTATEDLDGDQIPEVVIAAGFSPTYSESTGEIYLLKHDGDPRAPWSKQLITRIPMTHRMFFADLDSDLALELVVSPITGPGKDGLESFDGTTGLFYFETSDWSRHSVAEDLFGTVHGVAVVDWDGADAAEILVSSFEGVLLFQQERVEGNQPRWTKKIIHRGNRSAILAEQGSSDVRLGQLSGERRFLVAIEPFHGNQVVIYTDSGQQWHRQVIDDSLQVGHALALGDLNGDGREDVVVGERSAPGHVYVYYAEDNEGLHWRREQLDTDFGANSCIVSDLDRDARMDVICAANGNGLRWYVNLGSMTP